MSSWCIEYWKVEQEVGGSHAQFKHISYVKPDHKDISRRYFSDYKGAKRFTKSIFDYGYHTNLIKE